MKKRSRNLPLARIGDSPAMTEAIAAIRSWNHVPARPLSDIQIKIRNLSYYPDSGVMNFDGKKRERETGLAALRVLLDETFAPDKVHHVQPVRSISLDD
jgi:hypothetical protein